MEEQQNKKGKKFSLKNLSKKDQIRLTIIGGVIALLVIVAAFFIAQRPKNADDADAYKAVTLKNADDLVFNGTVSAERSEEFYKDESKGTLANILVTNGQEIAANTALLAYQNETQQEQVDEQQGQIEKLNLAVTTAQQNLDNAYAKKQELQNDKSQAASASSQAAAAAGSTTGAASSGASQYDDALSAQDDAILQAQQALDSANLDLTTANQALENAKSKVTTNVSSTIDGIAVVDTSGKGDATVPVVKVVSKSTIIEAKVSEYDYSRVLKDQTVTILPANDTKKIQGTITEVNKLPDNSGAAAAAGAAGGAVQTSAMANYTFKVKPAEDLQYGYNCQISLPVNELRVPKSAITKENDKQYVFVYSKGKAHKTFITTVEKNGVFVVTEGLKEKDRIISNPDKELKDGQEVTVN